MFDDILYICLCSKWISIVSQSVQYKFNIYICIYLYMGDIAQYSCKKANEIPK